jgi:hypothetical protein
MHLTAFATVVLGALSTMPEHLAQLPQAAQREALVMELQELTKRTTSYLILTTPQPLLWVQVAAAVLLEILLAQ